MASKAAPAIGTTRRDLLIAALLMAASALLMESLLPDQLLPYLLVGFILSYFLVLRRLPRWTRLLVSLVIAVLLYILSITVIVVLATALPQSLAGHNHAFISAYSVAFDFIDPAIAYALAAGLCLVVWRRLSGHDARRPTTVKTRRSRA